MHFGHVISDVSEFSINKIKCTLIYLFIKIWEMKNGLHSKYFSDNNAVIVAMKKQDISIGTHFYKHGIQVLEHCWC